jgi:hypothetical protein
MPNPQFSVSVPSDLGITDEQKAQARLDWLQSAQSEEEVHLIEMALLAETDNGPQPGDPDEEGQS